MNQIRTGEKNFIELEEYKGTYSLAACYEGSDGTVRKEWALRQTGRDKHADKDTPVKVVLGDAQTAVAALKQIIKQIEGGADVPF